VIATFLGPVVAVGVGGGLALWQFFSTREANQVWERYIQNGVSRLRSNILELTTLSLINYQIASITWRTFREYPKGSPLAPRPEDLSSFVDIDRSLLSFDPVTITQEILGTASVTKWCAHVFSDCTLALREYESQLSKPLSRYYDPNTPREAFIADRERVITDLRELIERANSKASRHGKLHDILYDIEIELLRKRVRRYEHIPAMRKRERIKQLIKLLEDEYEKIEAGSERKAAPREPGSSSG